MDERSYNNLSLIDYKNNNITKLDSPSSPKQKGTKNILLKYHYNFIISLIIAILFMTGYIISKKGILNIISDDKNVTKEFNITNFYITDDTCQTKNDINIETKNYYENIDNFVYSRQMIIYIGKLAMLLSLLLLGNIFYIKFKEEKGNNQNEIFFKSSFFLCLILFIIELLLFNILLYLFLRLFDVINFLEGNIKNDCILFIHWDYNEKVLKHLMKMIMVLELLKICNLQILVYFLKKLIILNNFFFKEITNEKKIQSNT